MWSADKSTLRMRVQFNTYSATISALFSTLQFQCNIQFENTARLLATFPYSPPVECVNSDGGNIQNLGTS